MGQQSREGPLWTDLFLLHLYSSEKCVCVCVCVCERVCDSLWRCSIACMCEHVCLCASESACGDTWLDAAWTHSVQLLTYCRVAVGLLKSAWMSTFSFPLLSFWVLVLLLERVRLDSAAVLGYRDKFCLQIGGVAALARTTTSVFEAVAVHDNVHMIFFVEKTDFGWNTNSSGDEEASFMLPNTLTRRETVWN